MSLKVWLPLLGSLENKGTDNIAITNNGATVNTSGKIGSCYSFDGSDDYISINDNVLYSIFKGGTQPFSIAMWVYHGDSTRAILFGDYGLSGAISFNIELTTGHVVRFYWASNPDYTTPINVGASTWAHIAITYDGSSLYSYKDGSLIGSRSGTLATLTKSSGVFYLGRDSRTGTTALNGKLNDFRVYDHCLSKAEIKEIARGMVAHYKLDDMDKEVVENYNASTPSGNVFSTPTFNTSSSNGGWNHWGPSGHTGTYGQTTDKSYIFNKSRTYAHWFAEGEGNYYLCYQCPGSPGGYRSMQCILKEQNGLPITESIVVPALNGRTGGAEVGVWTSIKYLGDGFYYCKFEGVQQAEYPSGDVNSLFGFRVLPNNKVYISECYLENASTCTTVFDAVKTIRDSSGYGRNATITGAFSTSTDTPRFGECANAPSGANYASVTMPTNALANSYTFSWWGKTSITGNMPWGFQNGNRLNPYYTSYLCWNTGDGSSNPFGTVTSSTYNNGTWHHYVITGDGTTTKLYIDGVFMANAKTYKAITGSTLYISGWDAGSSYKWNGFLSDFRIYATPLTAFDVKQLYEVETKIAKKGDVHAFEFSEEPHVANISNQGVLSAEELIESDKAAFYKNKSVSSTGFIEI